MPYYVPHFAPTKNDKIAIAARLSNGACVVFDFLVAKNCETNKFKSMANNDSILAIISTLYSCVYGQIKYNRDTQCRDLWQINCCVAVA